MKISLAVCLLVFCSVGQAGLIESISLVHEGTGNNLIEVSVSQELIDKLTMMEKEIANLKKENENMKDLLKVTVLRSCAEYIHYGIKTSGRYMIDPDGKLMGQEPFQVYCDFSTGATHVLHDSENLTEIEHCHNPGCYSKKISYINGLTSEPVSMNQIFSLMELSEYCEQDIRYDCTLAPLQQNGINYAWWKDRYGDDNVYFTGSHKNEHVCDCHYSENGCVNAKLENNTCNCNSYLPVPTSDTGTITNMTALPIMEMYAGGLDYQMEVGAFQIGQLKCYGEKSVEPATSCSSLKKTGVMTSGYYNIKPTGVENIKLVFCDMQTDSYTDVPEKNIEMEDTFDNEITVLFQQVTQNKGVISNNTLNTSINKQKIGSNTGKININTGKISSNTVKITNNTVKINTNTVKISSNIVKINTNTVKIDSNTGKIDNNTEKINSNTEKINSNTVKIESNTAEIENNIVKIKNNTGKIENNTVKIDSNILKTDNNILKINKNTGKIDSNTGKINSNTGKINSNTGKINSNAGKITSNTGKINSNLGKIDINTGNIDSNTGNINSNTEKIESNTGKINTNTGKINSNTGKINSNTGKINSNTGKINSNTGKIDSNTGKINSNTGKIDSNTVKIDSNTGKINSNTGKINNNTGKINSNTVKINNNTGKINTNTGKIDSNTGKINTNTDKINSNTGKVISNTGKINIIDATTPTFLHKIQLNQNKIQDNLQLIRNSSPLGTIVAWVPRPETSLTPEVLPDGWLPCDGTTITKGPWAGGKTPDLNSVGAFLRGSSVEKTLEMEMDQMQDHIHDDSGHSHSCSATSSSSPHHHTYEKAIHSDSDGQICGIDGHDCDKDAINYSSPSTSSRTVSVSTSCSTGSRSSGIGGITSSYRHGSETRPRNMKVNYIIRCW